ncbi:MAG: hypothetical protein PHG31_05870 [Candidatus Omnitrophica bacterium]|nr:hypothetical protein [Candidatus Omnitrophota bacterium]
MNYCLKDIFLHNVKIRLRSNHPETLESMCAQMQFPKFRAYPKYIEVSVTLTVEFHEFKNGRGDSMSSYRGGFQLSSWTKNIQVYANRSNDSIHANLLLPNVLPPETILHLAIIEPLRHILLSHGMHLLHAAAVVKGKRAILICCGPAGGKSTLATACISKGFDLLSDEFVIVKGRQLYSFPLKIKLEPKSLPHLGIRSTTSAVYSFYAQERFPVKIIEKCKPSLALFIFKGRKRAIRPALLTRLDAFALLAHDRINSLTHQQDIQMRRSQMQALAYIAESAKSYAVTYDLARAMRIPAILETLIG